MVLWLMGFPPQAFQVLACIYPELGQGQAVCDSSALGTIFLTLLVAGAGVLTSAIYFQDSFSIFKGISIFLFGFMTLPTTIFNSVMVDWRIKIFLGGLFGVAYLIALISWSSGKGEM